jgi:hypothetical protein
MTRDQIMAALPELSKADLTVLQAVINGLIGPSNDLKGPRAYLIEALGVNKLNPVSNPQKAAFNKHAPAAIKFMEEQFPEPMNNRTTAIALWRYVIKLLVDDLKGMGYVIISAKSVCLNLHRIPEVFEKAFPGYGKGAAAMLILTSLKG